MIAAVKEEAAPVVESAAPPWKLNLATMSVLVSRDLKRFFRQKSRVIGALVQPLIFWLVIGSGLAGSFKGEVGYVQYFYPGIVMLVVLFTSIFTTMSVIEDRHKGFLQAVLVAPASRAALVLGKTGGGVAIAMAQALMFLCLLPLAGYDVRAVDWPLLGGVLLLTSIGLSSMGFAIAWWLDSTQGYHVVMSVLLIPLWILSGAMFPLEGAAGWIRFLMRLNPMAYCVSGIRHALAGGSFVLSGMPLGTASGQAPRLAPLGSPTIELAVAGAFAVVATLAAVWLIRKKP
jgi:daunorubicin resistance ABC transporter membrane protein